MTKSTIYYYYYLIFIFFISAKEEVVDDDDDDDDDISLGEAIRITQEERDIEPHSVQTDDKSHLPVTIEQQQPVMVGTVIHQYGRQRNTLKKDSYFSDEDASD